MNGWSFEYTIDADADAHVVYEKIFGVWREETARDYVADFEEEIQPLIKKPWVRLCDLGNWKTATPEVIEIVGTHLVWCREHNLMWSVNVINNPVTYGQLQRMFNKGGTREISKTFRSRQEAERFLKSEGFNVRSTPSGMTR